MLRASLTTLMLIGLGLLGASYGGALHPLGDALAVFRLHISGGCLLVALCLLAINRRLGGLGIVLALAALAPILWATLIGTSGQPGAVMLYQKNMLFQRRDLTPLEADIRAADTDLLTLQEVTPSHAAMLTSLSDLLPTQLTCPFARVGAVAVASRWPMVPDSEICLEGQGLAAIQIRAPEGPLWLVSIHLHWPWPHGQAPQRARLLPVLAALEGPVLIGGDFNMVPWSHSLRSLSRASRTKRIGRAYDTMTRFSPWVPLPIDHVLIPTGAQGITELRPLVGSDHHGILAKVSPGVTPTP